MGSLIDLCSHFDLPSSGFLPAGTDRAGSAQPSWVLTKRLGNEKVKSSYDKGQDLFSDLGFACLPHFYPMLLNLGRDVAYFSIHGLLRKIE